MTTRYIDKRNAHKFCNYFDEKTETFCGVITEEKSVHCTAHKYMFQTIYNGEQYITNKIRKMIDECDDTKDKETKIKIIFNIFGFLENHLWFLCKHPIFSDTVFSKIIQLNNDLTEEEREKYNIIKYIDTLFPLYVKKKEMRIKKKKTTNYKKKQNNRKKHKRRENQWRKGVKSYVCETWGYGGYCLGDSHCNGGSHPNLCLEGPHCSYHGKQYSPSDEINWRSEEHKVINKENKKKMIKRKKSNRKRGGNCKYFHPRYYSLMDNHAWEFNRIYNSYIDEKEYLCNTIYCCWDFSLLGNCRHYSNIIYKFGQFVDQKYSNARVTKCSFGINCRYLKQEENCRFFHPLYEQCLIKAVYFETKFIKQNINKYEIKLEIKNYLPINLLDIVNDYVGENESIELIDVIKSIYIEHKLIDNVIGIIEDYLYYEEDNEYGEYIEE